MLEKLTSRQLVEWQAYFQAHPFGDDIRDYMVAQLSALVCNLVAGKSSNKAKVTDFLPLYREPEQTTEQMKRALRGVLSGVNNGKKHPSRAHG